jgi:hypothetical protein
MDSGGHRYDKEASYSDSCNLRVHLDSCSDCDGNKMTDKWLSPTAHQYSFSGYGGVTNCSICDDFTQANEYDRRDGLVVFLCKACQDRLHL